MRDLDSTAKAYLLEGWEDMPVFLTEYIEDHEEELRDFLFERKNPAAILRLLEILRKEMEEYAAAGIVRPWYFLDQAREHYLERAASENLLEMKASILEYLNALYSQEELEEAQEDLSNLEFGLRKPYLVERFLKALPAKVAESDPLSYIGGLHPGQSFVYGVYPQGRKGELSELLWDVLEKEDGRILAISHFAIDGARFHDEDQAVTWEECSLRQWLNGYFIGAAFDDEEWKAILSVTITTDSNREFEGAIGSGGKDTIDRIFLLSVDELRHYYVSDRNMEAQATDFAEEQGVGRTFTKNCGWFTRSPGYSNFRVISVQTGGGVYPKGYKMYNRFGVRPAMWLSIGNME